MGIRVNQLKKPAKKPAGNSRIKKVGDTHWVLHKHTETKKYKGFKGKSDAENFAAAHPLEKGVKINAEKVKPKKVKKSAKKPARAPQPKIRKAYSTPRLEVVGLDRLPPAGKDPKVKNFSEGKAKYRKRGD